MARSKPRGLRGAELRAFRRSVSILKRKGLTSPKVNAAKQRPTRYMRRKVRDFADAIAGKVEPVRLSPKIAREYRDAGFQVTRNRVLMAPDVARRIRRSKAPPETTGGYPSDIYDVPGSDTLIQRVYLPAGVNNWDKFFERLRRGDFEKLKRPQDVFAFTFFGGMSQKTFKTGGELADWLQHYQAVSDYPGQSWQHFIIYKVYPPGTWEELGGGLTYRVPRGTFRRGSRGGRRDARGNPLRIGSRAKRTMDEIRQSDRERKAKLRKTPEYKEMRAKYMKEYRAKIAREQGYTIRPYKKRDL